MNPRIVLGLLIAALVVTTLLGYYGVARRVQGWMAYQDLAPQLDNESDPMRPAALARLADEDRAIPDARRSSSGTALSRSRRGTPAASSIAGSAASGATNCLPMSPTGVRSTAPRRW